MTMKKTLRVPLAADGVPIIEHPQALDKTRELPAVEDSTQENHRTRVPAQAAPKEIVDDEITVPVQSSIESTLTYELLRRQSTVADEDEE
jgi:Cu/Ag efflux pump CusA